MPITLVCPFCDQPRQIPEGFPGEHVKCHKCGSLVRVPAPEEEEELKRRRAPAWMIALLIVLVVLAVFLLGTVAMQALLATGTEGDGGESNGPDVSLGENQYTCSI